MINILTKEPPSEVLDIAQQLKHPTTTVCKTRRVVLALILHKVQGLRSKAT